MADLAIVLAAEVTTVLVLDRPLFFQEPMSSVGVVGKERRSVEDKRTAWVVASEFNRFQGMSLSLLNLRAQCSSYLGSPLLHVHDTSKRTTWKYGENTPAHTESHTRRFSAPALSSASNDEHALLGAIVDLRVSYFRSLDRTHFDCIAVLTRRWVESDCRRCRLGQFEEIVILNGFSIIQCVFLPFIETR